jgi:hypothetical protein
MDENWLLLRNNNKYCYWDCQNQQLTNTSVEYHTNRQHVLIDNYNRDAGSTTLTIGQQAWSIIRGEQVTDLTNVSRELKNSYAAGKVVPIDNRIMFSYWYSKYKLFIRVGFAQRKFQDGSYCFYFIKKD